MNQLALSSPQAHILLNERESMKSYNYGEEDEEEEYESEEPS